MDRRVVVGVVVVATLVAAALRLTFLNHQSLWFDEIFTQDIVGEPTLSGLWHHVKATESTPPLSYVIAWLLGGRSAAAMRAIPAVALVVAVPVSYLAFRRLVGREAATAVAAILAVSPILVSYSTDARAYGLLVLTGLLTVWAFSALREHRSRRRYALWVLSSVACVWTHYFGALVVGAEVALLLLDSETRRATVGWTAVIVAGLAPLIPLALNQSGDERAAFIAGISLGSRLTSAVRQFAMGPNVPRAWLEAGGIILLAGAVAVGLVIAWRQAEGGMRTVTGLTLIVVGVPLLGAALGVEDRFYARNLVAAVPLVAAGAAPALLRGRGVPLALYLCMATATSLWVATDWRYEQLDWRGALARVETIDRAAPVVTPGGDDIPVARTYLGRTTETGVVSRRVWVIVPPLRAKGQRALAPSPAPVGRLPGFQVVRELQVHGFRLLLLGAIRPTEIAFPAFPGRS
jgi:4-amino-4-deoxy-L-arabinose transferase-like glycosyltransferase